jgi:4-carboxymuconolactone decarboxylase
MGSTQRRSDWPPVIRPDLRDYLHGPRRVDPVTEVPADVEEFVQKLSRRPIMNIFGTLAHNPRLLKRFGLMSGGLLGKGTLPAREREIVILRMGWRCGAEYEFGQHTVIGLDAGLTHDEVRRITLPCDRASFPPDDDSLLHLVDELYDGNAVSDTTWNSLAARWPASQMVELVVLAGFYWMVCALLNSCRVDLEPGAMGWPTDDPTTTAG